MKLQDISSNWLYDFSNPFVIAGPCSAESESQMLETAERILKTNTPISLFRAGIWKPRTQPNSFEGVGEIGLKWLAKVKQEFGFKTTVEVANANHVKAALDSGVDVLWIGARSTTNPFTVQEIADALKDSKSIVLVKNPVNPDLALWIGALERLLGNGVQNLGAIHRGFSTYQKSKYRNTPNWQIALDFKNQFPNIPMIIDPSHICGNRTSLFTIAQEAYNLGYEGMMLETHCQPELAWTDAKQQVTPERFSEICNDLVIRSQENIGFQKEIEKYRLMITDLDHQLVDILSQRMKISEKIGIIKHQNNATIFQPERWKAIIEFISQKSKEVGISKDFLEKLFKDIHEESIQVQHKTMKTKNTDNL